MSGSKTADKIWATLNVSSIGLKFNREKKEPKFTQTACTKHPCATICPVPPGP